MKLRIREDLGGNFKYQVQKKGLFGWYDLISPDGGAYFNDKEEAIRWCENKLNPKPHKIIWE